MSDYKHTIDPFFRIRRKSLAVNAGKLQIGGDAPIVVQSMTTTPTRDIEATVKQCITLAEADCQMVRITAPGVNDSKALAEIRKNFSLAGFADIPLVADIHFMPRAAMEAVQHVEKVRINPGNYADKKSSAQLEYTDEEYDSELNRIHERFSPLVLRAKDLGRCLRIGVNHGSLSDRVLNRFGDTPEGMVVSAMEFIRIAEDHGFDQLVISMKSSNPKVMVQAYRLLVLELDKHGVNYPLHLGVTEAGDGDDGRIKGASGIGTLLADGLGDTVRVSLTEEPELEIPVCYDLLNNFQEQSNSQPKTTIQPSYLQHHNNSDSFIINNNPEIKLNKKEPIVFTTTNTNEKTIGDIVLLKEGEQSDQLSIGLIEADTQTSNYSNIENKCVLFDLNEISEKNIGEALKMLPSNNYIGLSNSGEYEWIQAYRKLASIDQLSKEGQYHPICIALQDIENLVEVSSISGSLFIDGIGSAMYTPKLENSIDRCLGVFQAVKMRTTKTDYVSCPSCGRTLFDLMDVTQQVRDVTGHLKGLTIAVMGCIVNGPGEMADADFGYVGTGPGLVTLYKGYEPVVKNIPNAEACDRLVELIKSEGAWVDPKITKEEG
jgi:(E)-4-hydroxy-3-methylbut-2-enyl-diphosphate synthase